MDKLGLDRTSTFFDRVERIVTARAHARDNWMEQARCWADIIDMKLYKTEAGFDNVEEFIANYDKLKGDSPEYILRMVDMYKEFGDTVIKKLPYSRIRMLYELRKDIRIELKKDEVRLAAIAKKTPAEIRKTVAEIKDTLKKKERLNQKNDKAAFGGQDILAYDKVDEQRKEDAKGLKTFARIEIKTDGWQRDLANKSDSIMVDVMSLIKIAENVGDMALIQFIKPELLNRIQDLLDIVLNTYQHGEVMANNATRLRECLKKEINRKDGVSISQHLHDHEGNIETCRKVVKWFDAVKATSTRKDDVYQKAPSARKDNLYRIDGRSKSA